MREMHSRPKAQRRRGSSRSRKRKGQSSTMRKQRARDVSPFATLGDPGNRITAKASIEFSPTDLIPALGRTPIHLPGARLISNGLAVAYPPLGLRPATPAEAHSHRKKRRYFALLKVNTLNFEDPEKSKHKVTFDNLTPLFPDQRFRSAGRPDQKDLSLV